MSFLLFFHSYSYFLFLFFVFLSLSFSSFSCFLFSSTSSSSPSSSPSSSHHSFPWLRAHPSFHPMPIQVSPFHFPLQCITSSFPLLLLFLFFSCATLIIILFEFPPRHQNFWLFIQFFHLFFFFPPLWTQKQLSLFHNTCCSWILLEGAERSLVLCHFLSLLSYCFISLPLLPIF